MFVILVTFRFGLGDWIWALIASVPDLCILFTFKILNDGNEWSRFVILV